MESHARRLQIVAQIWQMWGMLARHRTSPRLAWRTASGSDKPFSKPLAIWRGHLQFIDGFGNGVGAVGGHLDKVR